MHWDNGSMTRCLHGVPNRECGWMPELRKRKEDLYEIHDVVEGTTVRISDTGREYTWVVASFTNVEAAMAWGLQFYSMHPLAARPGTYALPSEGLKYKHVPPIAIPDKEKQLLLLLN